MQRPTTKKGNNTLPNAFSPDKSHPVHLAIYPDNVPEDTNSQLLSFAEKKPARIVDGMEALSTSAE